MSSTVDLILSLLLLYKYWIIFISLFASAVFMPIPAVGTILLAAGAFSSLGYFNLFTSFFVAVLGNFFGDILMFFLAKKYGHDILHKLHIRIPRYFDKLEKWVKEYPQPTIFLSRFIGLAQILTSLLCGFIDIRLSTFIIYDLLGNIVSDGLIIYTGYILGTDWQDFSGLFNTTGYIIIGIIMAIMLSFIIWRKNKNK